MSENEIVRFLTQKNEEFRKLGEEHRRLDEMLSALSDRAYLTPEEELERQRLKKMKLQKKDRMAAMIRTYKLN